MNVPKEQNNINHDNNALSFNHAIILSLVAAFFTLPIPTSLATSITFFADFISWVICLVFGILVLRNTRRFSTIVIIGLTLTFFVSLTGSPVSLALVLGTISSAGAYSALAATAHKWQIALLLLTPAVAFATAYAMTLDVMSAISVLIPLLPALAMGIDLRIGKNRVHSIVCFSAVTLTEVAGVFVLYLYLLHGHISLELINESAVYFRTLAENMLTLAIENAGTVAVTENITIMIESMAIEMTNLLVGLITVSIIIFAFFAQKIQHLVLDKFELIDLANISGAPIKASVIAALIYVAAYICSFTSSPSSAPSFLAVAAGNISLILLPLLLCVGFVFMIAIPKKVGFLAVAAWLGIAAASYLLQSSVIDIIALVGAFYTIIVNIDLWAETHYSKGGDQ